MGRPLTSLAAAVVLAGLVVSCASTPRSDSARLVVSDDGADLLRVNLDGEWVRSVLEQTLDAELDCDGDLDGSLGTMLRALDRRGPRASATLRSGDTIIHARRRGSSLRLVVRDADGERLRITMPWTVAECLQGRSTRLGDALEQVEVEILGDHVSRVRLALGD